MVEMKETARILRLATPRSLILLDEVGRGTSTFDGISIAWSLAEFLHESPHRPRTLFATHYHELTGLARTRERVKNFNFAVKEWQGEVIFLRTLKEGPASRSYGIQVAGLAGLPGSLIERAREILGNLGRRGVERLGTTAAGGGRDGLGRGAVGVVRAAPRRAAGEAPGHRHQRSHPPWRRLNVLDGLVTEARRGPG